MMSLASNESTTPTFHPPLPGRTPGSSPGDQNSRHRNAHQTTPAASLAEQNTRHRMAHRDTPTVGQTAPVSPDCKPHGHPLPDGTRVVARHAHYSKTWDAAVIVSSRQRHGRTLYDIAWEDTSSGPTSGAIPQTRVQPSRRSPAPRFAAGNTVPPAGAAPRGPGPPPPPLPLRAPDVPPPPPYRAPVAGPSPPRQNHPPSPLTPGRRVQAKLGRHGTWCGATIVSFRGAHTNLTYTVRWDDTSLGDTSTRLPKSRVRQPQESHPPPPPGGSSLTSPSSPSVIRDPPLSPSSEHRVGQPPPLPSPPLRLSGIVGSPAEVPARRPKRNRTPWAPLVSSGPRAPPPEPVAGQVPTGAAVLLLYDDWVQSILDGVKTIEVRPKNTTKRSTIYLMASGTDEICGSVQILSSDPIVDEDEWNSLAPGHRIGLATNPARVAPFPPTPQYAWRLGTPVRFLQTVRAVRKKGQVDFLRFQPRVSETPPSVSPGPVPADDPSLSRPDTPQLGRSPPSPPPPPPSPSPRRTRPRPGQLGRSDARATATMSVLIEHQQQVATASLLTSHSAEAIADARSFVAELSAGKTTASSKYPFQQDEVAKIVARRSHRRFYTPRARPPPQRHSASGAEGPRKEWDTVLTAKYTGTSDHQHSAIAHGVFVPRPGPKVHTKLNADVSAEMRWLAQISGHRSHHLHQHTAEMWRILNQIGYDSNARIPALRRSESEVASAIAHKLRHSNAAQHQAAMTMAHASIAALQSTGHLVARPLATYTHDLKVAKARGLLIGNLSYATLLEDWTYHMRTSLDTSSSQTRTDRSTWDPDLIGVVENPADSSLFRRQAGPECINTMKHWGLRHIRRGAHFAHCSGGTTWRKEAYLPSNWGATTRRCHGDHAAHNCGAGRKHPISAAGKKEAHNEAPSTFTPHWKHIIPASLYFSILAGANRLSSTPLQGKCAVHVGSGTGSMRRALQLTGLFVIGVDIEHTVETGTRAEHTSYVADYDSFEGRFGDMVEAAIHRLGFSRADVVLIAFDADCSTRSRMTSNMNGKCRDMVSGQADSALPDGATAHRRDVIDRSAVQWLDSILHSHSDDVCVANAVRWPCGPGGWGLSDEDAHVLLTSTPKWDDANTSTHQSARDRSRTEFRRDNHSRASLSPRPPNPSQAPIHTGTASP